MATHKGYSAEGEFKSWFQTKGSFCFQFLDARMAKGTGGSNRIFTGSQPSDFLVFEGGEAFLAEVKSSQNETSFPFDSIQKSQWSAAMRTVSAGGSYYFFIRSEVLKKWFRVPAAVMLELHSGPTKSVRWEHLKPLEYIR